MMETWYIIAWAVFMGAVTALHPCPFSTIGAAAGLYVSLGRSFARISAFSLGILCAFTILGGVASYSVGLIPGVSHAVPRVFKPLLGPTLILAGMLQAGLIQFPEQWKLAMGFPWKNSAISGCFLGGVLLALAFCPATAGIFFVLVIPASLKAGNAILPSAAYGLGFALVPATLIVGLKACSTRLDRVRTDHYRNMLVTTASALIIMGGIIITISYTYRAN